MSKKRIDYKHQVTVCESRETGMYSLRNQGHLFWTGLEDDKWIVEGVHGTNGDYIFEITDKDLVYAIKSLLEYSLEKGMPMQLILNEL